MTQEDEEDYRTNIICRFCEKENISNEVRDHFHLTGKYRELTHIKCIINVKQSQITFFPIVLHNSSNYECHLFF